MIFKRHFYICAFLSSIIMFGCTDNDIPIKDKEEEKPPVEDEEKPALPSDEDTEVTLFNILNLDYPGLGTVKSLHEAGDDNTALKELLVYYINRENIKNPNVTSASPSEVERGYADYAIDEYRFYVNDNYLEDKNLKKPYSLQNSDKTINWNLRLKVRIMNIRSNCIATIGCRFKEKPIKILMMRNICFHGKKYIPIGLPSILCPKAVLISLNGISFKCPHALWGRRSHLNISKVLPTLRRSGSLFSWYTLRSMPIIYPNTNMPVKIISC